MPDGEKDPGAFVLDLRDRESLSGAQISPIGRWREDVRAIGLLKPTLGPVTDDLGSRGRA